MPKGGFWTSINGFEPKMQYRFKVYIEGMGLEDVADTGNCDDQPTDETLVWYAKTIEKPKIVTMDISPAGGYINHMNQAPSVMADQLKFEPITMTLIDPSYPNATRKILRWFRRAGYNDPLCHAGGFSSAKLRETIGRVYFEQLDWTGQVLETWELMRPYPGKVDFGKLDYSSDEMVEISITWHYESFKASMHGVNADLGVTPLWPTDPGRVKIMKERGFQYYSRFEDIPLGDIDPIDEVIENIGANVESAAEDMTGGGLTD